MVKYNQKYGFSLAEALISMFILAVFFGFAAKAVSQRPKEQAVVYPHGFYECYYDGDTLMQNGTGMSGPQKIEDGKQCSFTPASMSAVYDINLFLPDNLGVLYKLEPQINYKLEEIYIPTYSSEENTCNPNYEFTIKNNNEDDIVNDEDNKGTISANKDSENRYDSDYNGFTYNVFRCTGDPTTASKRQEELKNWINAVSSGKAEIVKTYEKDEHPHGGLFINW